MMAGRLFAQCGLAGLAIIISACGALAHHPMGGATPTTITQGLLSGIGHPILGFDHFAFVVGIGLLAGISGLGLALPALFVAAMTAGLVLHVASIDIPYVELVVALSVVGLGLAIWRRESWGARWIAPAFAAAGLFHGFALAETAIGAEATPLAAYIIGLCLTQMAIALVAWQLAGGQSSLHTGSAEAGIPAYIRLTGVAIAVIGIGHVVAASRLVV